MSRISRNALIDSTKGLACIAIVWHHLAFYGPMSTDRKFNRMRPSMARVLGLETRSAKEG